MELTWSNLEPTIAQAMVLEVSESTKGQIWQWARIWKQDEEKTLEICLSKLRCLSKVTPSSLQWCMSEGRSLASRQQKCCLGLASTFWYLASVLPRSLIMTFKLHYDIIIHSLHPLIFFIFVFNIFKTILHLCMKQRFKCKLNVFGVCVASLSE